jgi:hypothetical protein
MEARSQLRHRPTWGKFPVTILAHLYRLVKQTRAQSRLLKMSKMGILNRTRCKQAELLMNIRREISFFFVLIAFAGLSTAQGMGQAPAAVPPVSYSSIAELNQLVANLQQVSQSTLLDLARLRIDRWKTDGGTKQQTEKDAGSISQNLQLALPGMLNDLKNSPENLALTFKVYHDLDLLYDYFSSVTESAGAFGSKEEFQSLTKDLGALEDSRHAFAERMDKLANAKEAELGQLRAALQAARAEAVPKKVVVDDTAPPKKAPVRKKPVAKPATPPASAPAAQPATHP